MEDKKCRICGLADMANTNIYYSNTKLVEKIVAVYPIVLYPNDPLPKHICKKCLVSTTNMYAEIERAVRNQNKWISNVRAVQPDNKFVKVIDSIESANKTTAQSISKLFDEDLGERTICRLLNIKSDDQHMSNKQQNNIRRETIVPSSIPMDVDTTPPAIATREVTKNVPSPPENVIKKRAKITELKSVLELNGCTLTKVKTSTKTTSEMEATKKGLLSKVKIKEEPPSKKENPSHTVTCKMCPFRCETVEELAIHQLEHLNLCLPKLSERRYLDKKIRRGRLIKLDEKKCIRCLNCWRIFVDNKSILNHWFVGDCDFFCQICGKEFATSPKMLREHVPAAHGISYRSTKILRPPTFTLRNSVKAEKSPKKADSSLSLNAKHSMYDTLSIKVACKICHKVFANFKARNSHMRAHKGQPPPSLSDSLLALNNREPLLPVKDEPQDYDDIPYHIVSTLDTSATLTSASDITPHSQVRAPSNVILPKSETRTKSPAGIRRKYVQIRSDPKAIIFKTEPNVNFQVLKVKPLADLQDPSVSSQQPEGSYKFNLRDKNSSATPSTTENPASNGGIQPPKDNMIYGQVFNCHPCGGKFTSKLELFRHKRKCTANNLFPCQFCSRHFFTSADLQMHIILLHKNSAA